MSRADLLLNVLLRRIHYDNPEQMSTDEKVDTLLQTMNIHPNELIVEEAMQRIHDEKVLPEGFNVSLKWTDDRRAMFNVTAPIGNVGALADSNDLPKNKVLSEDRLPDDVIELIRSVLALCD